MDIEVDKLVNRKMNRGIIKLRKQKMIIYMRRKKMKHRIRTGYKTSEISFPIFQQTLALALSRLPYSPSIPAAVDKERFCHPQKLILVTKLPKLPKLTHNFSGS